MRKPLLLVVLATVVWMAGAVSGTHAQTRPAALSGTVSSAEEGKMEGVLVSAHHPGSTITVTVVSNAQGQYAFPAAKLDPGTYALAIRAEGYDLDGRGSVDVGAGGGATADLHLKKTADLAMQLTNADWLNSIPGTDAEKRRLIDCTSCHTLQRVLITHFTANQLMQIIPLMSGFAPGASPLNPELRKSPPRHMDPAQLRSFAEYIASVNLSNGTWRYALKTHPRPTGAATHVVYTEYDLPRALTEPHDVVLDNHGMAWYTDFGAQVLGELDPRTGAVTEYPMPMLKPTFPAGSLDIEMSKTTGHLWIGMLLQGGIADFDPQTKTFKEYALPPDINDSAAQIAMVDPLPNGQVITNDVDKNTVHLLDPATGQWQTFGPFKINDATGLHSETLYGVLTDAHNNAYALDFSGTDGNYLGKVDYATHQLSMIPTPTKNVRLRRGHFDAQNRLWFAEFAGNQIGMYDANTGKVTEWPLSPWTNPYDAVLDKQGRVWTGNMSNDLITRLDPKTGTSIEYLLPHETNVRRVFVEDATNPPTFWVGNNHGATVIKLEPQD